MAKLKNMLVSARGLEDHVTIEVAVKVSTEGIFSASISEKESLALQKYDPLIPDTGKKIGPFSARTLSELEAKLKGYLNDLITCELLESKEVIRYQIATACAYTEGNEKDGYDIYPNGAFRPKELCKERNDGCMCMDWKGGTENINAQWPSPYFTKVYCCVATKNTYAYRSGRELVRYEYSRPTAGYTPGDDINWLRNITSMSMIDRSEPKEIDATPENAAVFVQIIKFICKANRLLTQLAEPELLLRFAQEEGPLKLDFHEVNE